MTILRQSYYAKRFYKYHMIQNSCALATLVDSVLLTTIFVKIFSYIFNQPLASSNAAYSLDCVGFSFLITILVATIFEWAQACHDNKQLIKNYELER